MQMQSSEDVLVSRLSNKVRASPIILLSFWCSTTMIDIRDRRLSEIHCIQDFVDLVKGLDSLSFIAFT